MTGLYNKCKNKHALSGLFLNKLESIGIPAEVHDKDQKKHTVYTLYVHLTKQFV